jgi:hypothetical protein
VKERERERKKRRESREDSKDALNFTRGRKICLLFVGSQAVLARPSGIGVLSRGGKVLGCGLYCEQRNETEQGLY